MKLTNSYAQRYLRKRNQKHTKSFCLGVMVKNRSAVAKPRKPLREIDWFRAGQSFLVTELRKIASEREK